MPQSYEDNLSKEIEDIVSQIYEFHISESKSFDIYSYEKQVRILIMQIQLYSKSLSREFNICILQILTDKITILIKVTQLCLLIETKGKII
jgi:hypothetical protein